MTDLEGDLLFLAGQLNAAGLVLALRHVEAHPGLRNEEWLLDTELGLVVVDGARAVETVDGEVLLCEATLVELGHEGVGRIVGPQETLLEEDPGQQVAAGNPHVVLPGGERVLGGTDLVVVLQGEFDSVGEVEGRFLRPGPGGSGEGQEEGKDQDRDGIRRTWRSAPF
jgi:hypothetical protein